MSRVWVDLTNTAHVVVLRPLIERLEAAGHEVEITARPLSHTVELLEDWGHPFTQIGAYGGALAVGRTAPSYALYLAGSEGELTRRLLERLATREDVATVVLTRNAEQAEVVRGLGERLIVPARAVDGRSLVALADVLVSAGGS